MKTRQIISLLAGLSLGTTLAPFAGAADKTTDNVTVVFDNPEQFTDIRDSHTDLMSTTSLKELETFVQRTAASRIPSDSKLTVTFLDIDLAGMIRPDKDNIRLMTATTLPRAHLKFQLTAADGSVIKEGERNLSDPNYQQNLQTVTRNDPLGYDKELLKRWIQEEFKRGA